MLDRVQDQVAFIQDALRGCNEERESACITYEEELERYRDRIDSLEEQAIYQKTVMDVTDEEIDIMEGETETMRRKLREVVEFVQGDVIGKNMSVSVWKNRIIDIIDLAYV